MRIIARTTIAFGTPKPIPNAPRSNLLNGAPRGYDVLPDGRILSVLPVQSDGTAATRDEIRVVLNWLDELKRLVPTN